MRLSSLRCYQQIKDEGLLGKCQEEVWEALIQHGPCTAGELHRHMELAGTKMNHPKVNARLSELRHGNTVVELPDMRKCQVTRRMVLVFDVKDELPTGIQKRISNKQKIKDLESQLVVLRARCTDLETENTELKKKGQLSLL